MNSYIKSWEYQAYSYGKEIVENRGTLGGIIFAEAYRKLPTPSGLTWQEQMHIATLMEIHILCVGIDDDGELFVDTK